MSVSPLANASSKSTLKMMIRKGPKVVITLVSVLGTLISCRDEAGDAISRGLLSVVACFADGIT